MKRLLLSLALLLSGVVGAAAQTPCGGVNFVPAPGVSCLLEPTAPSFAATGIGIVPASTATDVACITGSATKVVRIQTIRVSGTAGTQIIVPVVITKHASVNTGGTPATGTALPVPYALDSSNAAATATTTAWTANPTIADSSPGIIDIGDLILSKTDGTNGAVAPYTLFEYNERNFMQAPLLRSAAQQICVNLNSTSPSSGLVNVSFKWTELAQ